MHYFTSFKFTSRHSYVELFCRIERFPILFVFDCVSICFFIRQHLKIKNFGKSLLLSLFLSSFPDNFLSFAIGRKPLLFEDKLMVPYFFAVWFLLNYFPFDLIFKLISLFKYFIFFIFGFSQTFNITRCLDKSVEIYPVDLVYELIFGLVVGIFPIFGIYIYSRIEKSNNFHLNLSFSFFIPLFISNFYFWFTDLGHISTTFWFDKEEMRLFLVLVNGFIWLFYGIFQGRFFSIFSNFVSFVISNSVPYYGSTWILDVKNINQQKKSK
uniref:Uncharacterized protein n=1 Tax=Coptotermes formosanus TaxID=36987 RepID=R4UVD4_COPFO|nr:hypothetical protein [Coptotermes formosanus]